MKQLLYENKGFNYSVTDTFESDMLVPITKNLLYKAEKEWDDYNEVFHCCRFIETVCNTPEMKMDFHFIRSGQQTVGVGLATYGVIEMHAFFPDSFMVDEPVEGALIFSYFHICAEARGTGEHWLKDIILPYYKEKGFASLYVKSSHPKVFSLYGRLGECVGQYSGKSDNELYLRSGKIFRIRL